MSESCSVCNAGKFPELNFQQSWISLTSPFVTQRHREWSTFHQAWTKSDSNSTVIWSYSLPTWGMSLRNVSRLAFFFSCLVVWTIQGKKASQKLWGYTLAISTAYAPDQHMWLSPGSWQDSMCSQTAWVGCWTNVHVEVKTPSAQDCLALTKFKKKTIIKRAAI